MKRTGAIFGIIGIIALMLLAGCSAPAPEEPAGEPDVIVEVTAANYSFSPDTITVKKDQIVQIDLINTQGTHDWVLDEFNATTAIVNAGTTTSVKFVAAETGEFEYYCSVGNHRALGMVGTLMVEE